MEILIAAGFIILFCGAMLWLYLCHRLFQLLASYHHDKFVEMGSPDLGENNTLEANVKLFKFIYHREYLALSDARLESHGRFMRALMFFLGTSLFIIFASVPFLATIDS